MPDRINLRIIIILFFSQILSVQAQNWKPTTAAVTFKIKHALGSTADGSFKGFIGTVVFDAQNLANASLKASVDTKTIDTGLGMRDKAIRGGEYFDVEKYPKISMVSTKIEKGTKENEYIGYFNLTIKKTTKNVKIPFTFVQNGTNAQLKGTFQINRLDYEVGEKSALLGDVATVSITLNAQQ
ncbi:MAG: YceI family protein [Spirosomaceae bacterium]|jgi:polyisoprenoid-binding protein YceI|nr:YceI family protein [Spirosomataceae bacterium]